MTDDEKKRIATKIAKCLALSTSDNPGEAEAAKRQADALMKKFNLDSDNVAASSVNTYESKTGGKYNPPKYLLSLARVISDAFGCDFVFSTGEGWTHSHIIIMGVGNKPELARYTFDVLRRQINKDRVAYTGTLKRFKRSNKTRMADLFCIAWVQKIRQQVRTFAGTAEEKKAIEAYQLQRWADTLKVDDRKSVKPKESRDWGAMSAGFHAADNVSLHKPVQTKHGKAISHEALSK